MKNLNQYCAFLILLLLTINTFAQVSLTKFPGNNQIYQRNNENNANVLVEGEVSEQNASVTLKVILNGNTIFEQSQSGRFSFNPSINAGKNNHIFKLIFNGNQEIKTAENVSCGDIFLFYGQSNALGFAGIWDYKASKDEFLRFYHVFDYNSKNGGWFVPSKTSDKDGVGLIALELQRILLERHNMPIGIIQCAEGGRALHECNDRDPQNPFSPGTMYGRMLTKVSMSGMSENIKYFVFRQGEADASGEAYSQDYPKNFDKFQKNLNTDLPNISRFYNFQVHIPPINNPYAGYLRDFQRRTKYIYPKISTLTNIGTLGFDGVHFSYEGYLQTPVELARIVSSEIFHEGGSPQIYSPDIQKATLQGNKIILEFDGGQEMVYPADLQVTNTTRRMKDFIYIDGRNDVIQNAYADGNKIVLEIANIQNPKKISYLPPNFVDQYSQFYNGVYLKNKLGMTAFSFENIQINGSGVIPNTLSKPILNLAYQNKTAALSWNNVSANANYHIEKSIDKVNFNEIFATTENFHNDYQVIEGKKYFYRIWAEKENVISDKSEIKEIDLSCIKDIKIENLNDLSTIFAGNSINILVLVNKAKEITLSAKKVVDLEDGFDTEAGSNFTAEIGGCENLN